MLHASYIVTIVNEYSCVHNNNDFLCMMIMVGGAIRSTFIHNICADSS